MVNVLRRQGLEIHKADSNFKAGAVDVAAGDYVIRADQPYRTLADMYSAADTPKRSLRYSIHLQSGSCWAAACS